MDLSKLGFDSVENKVIFISGASNGIGKSLALLLGGMGAKLVLAARRDEKLQEIAEELSGDVLCIKLDVQDEAAVDAAVEQAISKFGKIDVLVNNAGLGVPTMDLSDVDTDAYKAMMRTNVDGVFYLTRAVLGHMKAAKEGHIVNISSTAGLESNPVAPIYCSTKFAVEGFNKGLHKQAKLWKAEGVNLRVSDVRPDKVDSGYWGKRDVPRHEMMSCDDMAAVIFWAIAANKKMNVVDVTVESVK